MFEKCVCEKEAIKVQLEGGYLAELCKDCINEWSEFSKQRPEHEEYHLTMRLLTRAVNNQSNDLEALSKREVELHTQLYYLAKKWVKERRAKYAEQA